MTQSTTKTVSILNKKLLFNITLFETVLFLTLTITGTGVFIFNMVTFSNHLDTTTGQQGVTAIAGGVDASVGIISAITMSRRGKGSPIFMISDAFLYGVSNALSGNVALGIVNTLIIPCMGLLAFVGLGPRNASDDGTEVKTKKLDLKNGVLLAFGIAALASIFAVLEILIFPPSTGASTPGLPSLPGGLVYFKDGFDSFAATIMLAAVLLGVLRYRETGFLYFLANALKIVLFSLMIAYGRTGESTLLVISTAYFVNTMYGMVIGRHATDKG